MASEFKISNAAASAAADAYRALLAGGTLRIYSGTKPASVDTAIGAQVILAELSLANPAFPAAVNGVITANAITGDASANATGTASFYRAFSSGGAAVCDGTVGTADADLILNSVALQAGAAVNITSWVITQGKG